MRIEFDPKKSERNLRERGLSFSDVEKFLWHTAETKQDTRFNYPEPRFISAGYLADTQRLHIVCFTPIPDGIRVISFRKANRREVKKYEKDRTLTID